MKVRFSLPALFLCLCLLTACAAPAGSPSGEPSFTEPSGVTTAGVTTTEPTERPTRPEVTLPTAVEALEEAHPHSSGGSWAENADLLFFEGAVYHAVNLSTILAPVGEAAGTVTSAVSRSEIPAREGECNCEAWIGSPIFVGKGCLFTVIPGEDGASPALYRQWLPGEATYENPTIGGFDALCFEGGLYHRLFKVKNMTEESLDIERLTEPTLPESFVYAGRVLILGGEAPNTEYGTDLPELFGKDIYASAVYPSFLYVGSEQEGYQVMVCPSNPLCCGSIRQDGDRLDLSAAAEEDLALLTRLLDRDSFITPSLLSLDMFGITEVVWPAGADDPEVFALALPTGR